MTMTNPLVGHEWGEPWTVDDLADPSDDGNRYEIFDGSLLVSPPPAIPHLNTVYRLRRGLEAQAAAHLAITENGGVLIRGGRSYLVPDLAVVSASALSRPDRGFTAMDILLVVEVLSRDNAGRDLILKRHEYAAAGIPQYWIADKDGRTLTVLRLDQSGRHYEESAVIKPGERLKTDEPFPIDLDLGEIF